MNNELIKLEIESVEGEYLTQREYLLETLDRAIAHHKAAHDEFIKRSAAMDAELRWQSLRQSLNIFATRFGRDLCLGWIGKQQICITYRPNLCFIGRPVSKHVLGVWELELVKSELLNMGAKIDWDIYQWLLNSIEPRDQNEKSK